jgi:hypothetical protein
MGITFDRKKTQWRWNCKKNQFQKFFQTKKKQSKERGLDLKN